MDEQQFNEKYWFKNTHVISVVNPRNEDYKFQAVIDTGMNVATGKMEASPRQYLVKAGGQERFIGVVANMYLDQMSKLIAQDEDKFQFMIDFALKAQYYDQLIIGIENLLEQNIALPEVPSYLEVAKEKNDDKAQEVPFAAAKKLGRPPKAATEA